MWVEAEARHFSVGDKVRVRSDAYRGECGELHNGRLGVVVEIAGGDIVLDTEDDMDTLRGVHHPPYKLEKRIEI